MPVTVTPRGPPCSGEPGSVERTNITTHIRSACHVSYDGEWPSRITVADHLTPCAHRIPASVDSPTTRLPRCTVPESSRTGTNGAQILPTEQCTRWTMNDE